MFKDSLPAPTCVTFNPVTEAWKRAITPPAYEINENLALVREYLNRIA